MNEKTGNRAQRADGVTVEKIAELRKRAEDWFAVADKAHLRNTRHHYMAMKKIRAALSQMEPGNPANHVWLGILYHRLGREQEALLCFERAYALADRQRVKSDRFMRRVPSPRVIAEQCLMQQVGNATHGYRPEENPYVGGIGTISVPLLLVLDRVGIYYSVRSDRPGFQTRTVKTSGIGNIAFDCLLKGRPFRVRFRDEHGLTINPDISPNHGGISARRAEIASQARLSAS